MPRNKPKEKTKRQELRARRRQKQQQQRLIIFSIIAGVAVLLIAIAAGPMIRDALTPVGDIVEVQPNPRPQADFNAMGDPNAPVKIVEYSDFQCPFCGTFATETEPLVVENYVKTGKVHFEYVTMGNWVSNNIRSGRYESRNSGEAAYCAGDQSKFWEYHDMLFANTEGEDEGYFSDKRLTAFAEALGLDMAEFEECYDSHKYRDLVEQGYQEGLQAGVTGTPAFIINGKLVEGALPFSDPSQEADFQREIEAALAGQ